MVEASGRNRGGEGEHRRKEMGGGSQALDKIREGWETESVAIINVLIIVSHDPDIQTFSPRPNCPIIFLFPPNHHN